MRKHLLHSLFWPCPCVCAVWKNVDQQEGSPLDGRGFVRQHCRSREQGPICWTIDDWEAISAINKFDSFYFTRFPKSSYLFFQLEIKAALWLCGNCVDIIDFIRIHSYQSFILYRVTKKKKYIFNFYGEFLISSRWLKSRQTCSHQSRKQV